MAKRWIPPVMLERLKPLLGRSIYFSGRHESWNAASARAIGYESERILERVKQAALKVKRGEAAYERDSVAFEKIEHSYPVLAGLLRTALDSESRLSVLDFGGSLGSSYQQCRGFLSVLRTLKWGIVEQEHFVRCGRELFADEQLQFFFTLSECVREIAPNVALLSSVLQYLPNPQRVLDELANCDIPYLVIDRTPFSTHGRDYVTVQHVPPSIYPADYPCWIFARKPFLARLLARYDVLAEFDSNDGAASAGGLRFQFGGMIVRKRY
jgi:putative methyltransferase (TIGR04325 family)